MTIFVAGMPLGVLFWIASAGIATVFPSSGWLLAPAEFAESLWREYNFPPHGEAGFLRLPVFIFLEFYVLGLGLAALISSGWKAKP
jgi:hypothetical protein